MQIKINRNKLAAALSKVQGATGSAKTMPILSTVLLNAEDGYLKLTTTNLEVGIIEEIDVEVSKEGSICLPAKKLLEIVKTSPEKDVTITSSGTGKWAEIVSGKARFKVADLDPDDFPRIPIIDEAETVDVEAAVLANLLDKVIVSVSTDDSRYNLNGVYVEQLSTDGIKLVSTDGHRLAVVVHGALGKTEKRGHIVPRGGIQEFRKALDGADTVEMGFTGSHAVMRVGDTIIVTRLIEGDFPDYEQVIPEYSGVTVSIDRREAISIIKRVSILADDKTRGIRLDLENNTMKISTENPGTGDASEETPVEYAGEVLTMGFNARFLLEFLSTMSGKTVAVYAKDDQAALMLKCEGDQESLAIVMPMRVG
ncbi:DNA polymerase III subunit beta [Candidatus Pacearchaeota archaeon]|nr:DNA polymerase III subunit beta [Candidatus Pacearchaeota archaeon]